MVSANLVFVIDAEHPIKRWRAPNGLILDISQIRFYVLAAGNGWITIMKRWKEVEHGVIIAPFLHDNDYLLTLLISTIGVIATRNLPNPITTKFLTFASDRTIVAGIFQAMINGDLRKMTPEEAAYEIAAKNA